MALHTGFELPVIPEGTPMRESIEIEALVYYEGDQVGGQLLSTYTN